VAKACNLLLADIQFFEKIERQLVEAKQQDLAADLLKILLNKYRDDENPERAIELLKKILPTDRMISIQGEN
jgi:transcription elongation factor GreA-like protein